MLSEELVDTGKNNVFAMNSFLYLAFFPPHLLFCRLGWQQHPDWRGCWGRVVLCFLWKNSRVHSCISLCDLIKNIDKTSP